MHRDDESQRLTSPHVLQEVMQRHEFNLKKQLGQNFLIDANVLRAIVESSRAAEGVGVLEIGPGAGVVTEALSRKAQKVVAIEKDTTLQPVLCDTLSRAHNVEVVFADVLKTDLSALWARFSDCTETAVVANLPYYITTPILFHLFDANVPWTRIVVMVQREVADRLCAPPGGKDYGALTVAVRYRGDVCREQQVSRTSFLPPPNVDSTVLRIERHAFPPVTVVDEEVLFRVVRAAFATRRKTLRNALATALGLPKAHVQALLERAEVDGDRRGETLDLPEFARLANALAST